MGLAELLMIRDRRDASKYHQKNKDNWNIPLKQQCEANKGETQNRRKSNACNEEIRLWSDVRQE